MSTNRNMSSQKANTNQNMNTNQKASADQKASTNSKPSTKKENQAPPSMSNSMNNPSNKPMNNPTNNPTSKSMSNTTNTSPNNDTYFEKYNTMTHVLGRVFTTLVLVMLVGAPFLIGHILGAMPDLKATAKGFVSVGLIWTVSSIVEFLVYTPMLGAGGSYLAFITGNLINMKIPCAVDARETVGAKSGTPENEIISTLSIATSSLVTVLVLALGVLLLQPLQPVLQSPVLQPAFANVVAALFGAMAYKYFRGNMNVVAIPLTFLCLLFILVPSLTSSTSFMIIPGGGIAILISWLKYKKTA